MKVMTSSGMVFAELWACEGGIRVDYYSTMGETPRPVMTSTMGVDAARRLRDALTTAIVHAEIMATPQNPAPSPSSAPAPAPDPKKDAQPMPPDDRFAPVTTWVIKIGEDYLTSTGFTTYLAFARRFYMREQVDDTVKALGLMKTDARVVPIQSRRIR